MPYGVPIVMKNWGNRRVNPIRVFSTSDLILRLRFYLNWSFSANFVHFLVDSERSGNFLGNVIFFPREFQIYSNTNRIPKLYDFAASRYREKGNVYLKREANANLNNAAFDYDAEYDYNYNADLHAKRIRCMKIHISAVFGLFRIN